MRRTFIFALAALLTLVTLVSGCAPGGRVNSSPPESASSVFTRDISYVDFGGIAFKPWDSNTVADAVGISAPKAYTIMIYLNGSDLETESAEATKDILEMLSSGLDTDLVNVVIFTGGTYRWRNDAVPADECVIWRLERDGLSKITGVGLRDMGDAGTLSSFIGFSLHCFPAEKYGLIFWDHGGGSIAGYGHDELFGESSLTLLEMDYAFHRSGLYGQKLEFIGFDACLMATVEMAVIAAPYARYLIASQDLEPGDGWDYVFLGVLNENPALGGGGLGRAVADSYMDFYGPGSTERLTMSVTDLSRVNSVMGAMGDLMNRCGEFLTYDREGSFPAFSRRRNRTKTFGLGARRGNDTDMVDIADMSRRLGDMFPAESAALLAALDGAVVYNRHNSLTDLGGLASYYIFGGKRNAESTLGVYSGLHMNRSYTNFLLKFAGIINNAPDAQNATLETCRTLWRETEDGPVLAGRRNAGDTEDGGLWPVIAGHFVCLYKVCETANCVEYAVPVSHNGHDADLIIRFDGSGHEIVGTRREEGYMIQKGLHDLSDGDKISFYHEKPGDDQWTLSESVTISGGLRLDWRGADDKCFTRLLHTDICLNEYFTDT